MKTDRQQAIKPSRNVISHLSVTPEPWHADFTL